MHWNMADYLPPASRPAVVALVGDYILQTLNNVRDMRSACYSFSLHAMILMFSPEQRRAVSAGIRRTSLPT